MKKSLNASQIKTLNKIMNNISKKDSQANQEYKKPTYKTTASKKVSLH